MDMNTNQTRINFRVGVLKGLAHPALDASFYIRDSAPEDEVARVDLRLSNQQAVLPYELANALSTPEQHGTFIGIKMRIEFLKELRKLVAELEAIDEN